MEPLSLRTAIHDSSLGTATVNTLNALYHLRGDSHSSLPTFIPSATTLIALGAPPPDGESREFMRQLTAGAQATAISNFHDSILAGSFSDESNGEFTDVGLWLGGGDYQRGQEAAVLASLGLAKPMECSGKEFTTRAFETPAECSAGFLATYRKLKNAHCFCTSSGGVQTLCFLVGQIDDRWCGLVSIAITPD